MPACFELMKNIMNVLHSGFNVAHVQDQNERVEKRAVQADMPPAVIEKRVPRTRKDLATVIGQHPARSAKLVVKPNGGIQAEIKNPKNGVVDVVPYNEKKSRFELPELRKYDPNAWQKNPALLDQTKEIRNVSVENYAANLSWYLKTWNVGDFSPEEVAQQLQKTGSRNAFDAPYTMKKGVIADAMSKASLLGVNALELAEIRREADRGHRPVQPSGSPDDSHRFKDDASLRRSLDAPLFEPKVENILYVRSFRDTDGRLVRGVAIKDDAGEVHFCFMTGYPR